MNFRTDAMTILKPSPYAQLYHMHYIVCPFCCHGTYDAEVNSEQKRWLILLFCGPYHLMPLQLLMRDMVDIG
jgi:hypothetical protein